MYLAINYSYPARQLVQAGQIDVDYFKVTDWEWMIDEAKTIRPVAVHFDLEAGNGKLKELDWNRVGDLAKTTRTPYINLHLDAKGKHHPEIDVERANKSDTRRVTKIILADIQQAVARFGAENVILENSPYRGEKGNTISLCVEPEFISLVVKESGCGFLLDIAHAILSSKYIGMDTNEYFSRLPTDQLKELHFAGIHKIEGQLIDHLSIRKKNWKWLDMVIEHIQVGDWNKPWMLAFEYGGVGKVFEWRNDPNVMLEQIPQLLERISKLCR